VAKKTLVIVLVLFFVLSGVSWGIERVERNRRGTFLFVDGGWTTLDEHSSRDGFSLGFGIGGNFSGHHIGRFSFRYCQYGYKFSQTGSKWTGKIFDYGLSLKTTIIDVHRHPIANPYFGFGLGLMYAISRYEYSDIVFYPYQVEQDSRFFMSFNFFTGCDFALTEKSWLLLEGGFLMDIQEPTLFRDEKVSIRSRMENYRVVIGFGHKL